MQIPTSIPEPRPEKDQHPFNQKPRSTRIHTDTSPASKTCRSFVSSSQSKYAAPPSRSCYSQSPPFVLLGGTDLPRQFSVGLMVECVDGSEAKKRKRKGVGSGMRNRICRFRSRRICRIGVDGILRTKPKPIKEVGRKKVVVGAPGM